MSLGSRLRRSWPVAVSLMVPAVPARAIDWVKAREGMAPIHAAAASPSTYILAGDHGDIWSSNDGAAWTKRITPPGITASIYGAVYGGGRFVLVGATRCCTGPDHSALVLTSTDGIGWAAVSTGSKGTTNRIALRAVAYGASRFVAVGDIGTILSSPDGTTWNDGGILVTGPQYLKGVAFGGGAFVAVGDGRKILRSVDGLTWTVMVAPQTSGTTYEDVTHTGTQFVAVGNKGAILTSPDGLIWTDRSLTSPNQEAALGAVASGAGMIVAGDSLRVWSSPDGITWTARTLDWSNGEPNPYITTLAYGPSAGFVGTGINANLGEGGSLHSSTDGVTWTKRTLSASRNLAAVAYGNGVFCAAGSSGAVASSGDGITWTNRTGLPVAPSVNNTAFWRSVVVSSVGGNFVAIGGGIMTSPDCITWTDRSLGGTVGFAGLTEGLGILVAVGAKSPSPLEAQSVPVIATSTTGGASWTTVEPGGVGFIQKVAFRPASGAQSALFVAAGGGSNGYLLYTSADGVSWTQRTPTGLTGAYTILGDLTYGNGTFVMVNGANLWTSTDGVNWTAHGGSRSAYGVIYAGGKFASVGVQGLNFTSLDGLKWVGSNAPTTHNLGALAYAPGLDRFVAVGGSVITYATGNAPQASTVRYRLYHEGTKEHLYTTDATEYAILGTRGWNLEGAAHKALLNDSILDGTLPVALYRLYHEGIQQHLWTTDKNEYDVLGTRSWSQEGIDRYIMDRPVTGQTVPLYRLAHSVLPLHLWTTDGNEYNVLAGLGWVQEGIVGHVLP